MAFSKTGRTLYYHGQRFQSLKGAGLKSNYYDIDTGEDYWISGPKRDGKDSYMASALPLKLTTTFATSIGGTSGNSQREFRNVWLKAELACNSPQQSSPEKNCFDTLFALNQSIRIR